MTNLNNMINVYGQPHDTYLLIRKFFEGRHYSVQGVTEGPVYVGHCLYTAVPPVSLAIMS